MSTAALDHVSSGAIKMHEPETLVGQNVEVCIATLLTWFKSIKSSILLQGDYLMNKVLFILTKLAESGPPCCTSCVEEREDSSLHTFHDQYVHSCY